MDAKLRQMLTPKTKSPATLKNRVSYLYSLYRALDADSGDLSFLNDRKQVMGLVRNSENLGTQKTRMFHIVETIKVDPDKVVSKANKDYYAKEAERLKKPVAALEANNVMNQKQKDSFISIQSANLHLERYLTQTFTQHGIDKVNYISEEDFKRLSDAAPRKPNIYTLAKAIQECVIPALYIWQTALRNDWSELTITRGIIMPNTGNWLQVRKNGKMTLILNEYKTAKYFGKQKIPLDPKLEQLMSIWLNLLERMLGTKPKHPLYYSINAKGKLEHIENPETLARQLSRISQKIFNRPATINTFRHAHEMQLQESEDYKRMTVQERKDAHARLLHSLETGQKYQLQRRD